MHMLGEPRSMQEAPAYDDVVADVHRFLAERIFAAEMAGIPKSRIVVDPGFGFGKTPRAQSHPAGAPGPLPRTRRAGARRPVAQATIGDLTGRTDPHERVHGSVAAHLIAAQRGARLLRVHDVAADGGCAQGLEGGRRATGPRGRARGPAIRWPDDD